MLTENQTTHPMDRAMLEDSLRRALALASLLTDAGVRKTMAELDNGTGGTSSSVAELLALEVERAHDAFYDVFHAA